MGIFKLIKGRKGCLYGNDWVVKLNLLPSSHLTIGEQLTKDKATKIYNEVKEKLLDKNDFIEIETENTIHDFENSKEFFLKRNIVSVEMYDD